MVRRRRPRLSAAEKAELWRRWRQGDRCRRAPSAKKSRAAWQTARARASVANTRAWPWSRRPKVCRVATRPALREAVTAELARECAPQQIAGWLRHAYPDDPEMHVSSRYVCLIRLAGRDT
jgi:IS30 family transposase